MFQLVVFVSIVSSALSAALPKGLVPLLDGRIVGGQSTTIEEFPHQVSMRYFGGHRCGGSIVNENTIISAAHCVDGLTISFIVIRAGTTDRMKEGVDIKVSEVFMHEEYSRNTMNNDIAILTLVDNLKFTPSIQPVLLPDDNKIASAGSKAFVSGWGALGEYASSTNILQFVEVSVIDHEMCSRAYAGNVEITEHMLCAGHQNGGRDACQGDSGGPLIAFNENHSATLIGVVSWGFGCARPKHPGVYAKVPALRDWINEKFNFIKLKNKPVS